MTGKWHSFIFPRVGIFQWKKCHSFALSGFLKACENFRADYVMLERAYLVRVVQDVEISIGSYGKFFSVLKIYQVVHFRKIFDFFFRTQPLDRTKLFPL